MNALVKALKTQLRVNINNIELSVEDLFKWVKNDAKRQAIMDKHTELSGKQSTTSKWATATRVSTVESLTLEVLDLVLTDWEETTKAAQIKMATKLSVEEELRMANAALAAKKTQDLAGKSVEELEALQLELMKKLG